MFQSKGLPEKVGIIMPIALLEAGSLNLIDSS